MNLNVRELVRELGRSMWSRPMWALVSVLIAIAIGALSAMSTVQDSAKVENRRQELREQGWGLIRVVSQAGDPLSSEVCDELDSLDYVKQSGAISVASEHKALGVESGLSVTSVSYEIPQIVWPDHVFSGSEQNLVTPGLAKLTGLGSGALHVDFDRNSIELEVTEVSGITRFQPLSGGLVLLSNSGFAIDYCLAEVEPSTSELSALAIADALGEHGVIASPVVTPKEAAPTPHSMVESHRHQGTPLIAGTLLAALGALRVLLSKRDRAIYRLLGFARLDLWLMGLIDYLILIAAPWLSAYSAVILVAHARGVPTGTLGSWDLLLGLGASGFVALLVAFASASGKNRHQFAAA